jgi:signal transduction histidine kinase
LVRGSQHAGVDIVYRLELKGISASKLVGDPHRLGQMIKHLVDNAIKSYDGQRKGAGPSGDGVNTVEIRVRVVNKQLWSRRDDNHLAGLAKWNEVSRRDGLQVGTLTVEVEDHGKGIPDKEMKKLFTPFGQVEARGKSDGIGTQGQRRMRATTPADSAVCASRLGTGDREAAG